MILGANLPAPRRPCAFESKSSGRQPGRAALSAKKRKRGLRHREVLATVRGHHDHFLEADIAAADDVLDAELQSEDVADLSFLVRCLSVSLPARCQGGSAIVSTAPDLMTGPVLVLRISGVNDRLACGRIDLPAYRAGLKKSSLRNCAKPSFAAVFGRSVVRKMQGS